MNKFSRTLLAVSLGVTCSCVVAAQDKPAIPKVLALTREFTKPGKAGMVHDKAEGAFVQAMAPAKWPTHYIGITSMSGKPRALFMTLYEPFETSYKQHPAVQHNSPLS